MMESQDPSGLKSEAARAYDAGQYPRVVELGERLAEAFEGHMEVEDWYRYGQALRKTDDAGRALEVSRRLYRQNSDFPQVRMLYAWCIYDVAVSVEMEEAAANEQRFRRGVDAILELTGESPGQTFSPRERSVFRMVRYLQENRQDSAEDVLSWVHRLNPDELSDQIGYWRREEGDVIELPSDREKWYSAYTKALFELDRFQDCLDACEEALRRVPAFSGTNEIWFRRRRALCNGQLGFPQAAIDELEDLLEAERRWFILNEIAQLYQDRGALERARAYMAAAAITDEPDAYRWKLFASMASLVREMGDEDRARRHAELALSFRSEAGWSTGEEQKRLADSFGIDMQQLSRPGVLVDDLRPWWRELLNEASDNAS